MDQDTGKNRMERRYGEPGSGKNSLKVGGGEYRWKEVLARWMLDVEGVLSVDGGEIGDGRYWIRFLDSDDLCFVVFEFDANFAILSEMRVDSLEWEGDAFFSSRFWSG